MALAAPLYAQETQPSLTGLKNLREEVRQGLQSGRDAKSLAATLRTRASALESLAIENPDLAMQALLPAADAASLRQAIPSSAADIEQEAEWTGAVTTVVADDFAAHTSETHYWLDSRGEKSRLAIAGGRGPQSLSEVRLRGFRIGQVILASAPAIETLSAAPAAATCTTGNRSVLIVLVSFQNQALSAAVNAQTVANYAFGSSGRSVNLYWREVSSGLTSASGTVYPSVVTTNSTVTGGSQYYTIQSQVRSAVTPAVFDSYSHHIMIIPKTSDVGWAGLGDIGPCGQNVWVPDQYANAGDKSVEIFAHELGHNLGLNHASTMQFGVDTLGPPYNPSDPTNSGGRSDYGDWTSVMGIAQGYLGHYAAPHKVQLGWLQTGTDVPQVQSAGTYTLAPFENTSGIRALKVSRGGPLNQWIWVQFRQNNGLDGTYTGGWTHAWDGITMYLDDPLHWYGYSLMLDATPATSGDFSDAPINPGLSWQDPYSPLTIKLNGASPSGASVTVQYDTSCATLSSTSTQMPTTGGSSVITVTAPSNCSWVASSNVSWLTLTGTKSGTGNGSVSFTAAANAGPTPGTISVARQFFTVTESSSSLTPTTTSISSSSNPAAPGQGITLTAGVSPSTVTGSVQFFDGSTQLGSGLLTAGVAQFTTGSLSSGTHPITASYAGSSSYLASTSGTLNQTINCTYSLNGSSQSFAAAGGTSSIGITSQAGCGWTAASNAAWITVTGGSSGSSSGTVSFSVGANTSTSSRTGTLTVAGKVFTVTQSGAVSCSYSLSGSSQSFGSPGGAGSVGVTSASGCNWTAASAASWITVTGGSSGSSNGTVSFTVAANTSTSVRTGTITIAGNVFTITQAAATSCTYTLSNSGQSFGPSSVTSSVGVTSPSGCNWTATSNAAWITISGGSSGSANGTVTFTLAANTSSSVRTGTLTVAGNTFTVTQDGTVSCSYSVSSTSQAFGTSGGTTFIGVTAPAGCAWTATSNAGWISVTGGSSGSANGTVTYTVAANASSSGRTGTMTIAGQTITVTQAGVSVICSYSLNSYTQPFGDFGGTYYVGVSSPSGCNWTATSNAGWITIIGGNSGSANGTVNYTVASNTSNSSRTGSMTIAGNVFTVTQSGTTANSVPTVSTLNPTAGSGSGQLFSMQFSDSAGYQALGVVNVLINTFLDGRKACYLAYSQPTNTLYLVPDTGDGTNLVGKVMNGTGTLSNGQCNINLALSSAVGSGSVLTLNLSISFDSSFGGNRVVYLAAGDTGSQNSGWKTMGIYGVTPMPTSYPSASSVTPSTQTASNGTFSFAFDDSSSATNLQTAWVLVNSALDGRNACSLAYYRPTNEIFLVPDNGDGANAIRAIVTGSATLSNSQCTVTGLGVNFNGKRLTLTLNIALKPSFGGPKLIWSAAQTMGGGGTSAWTPVGTWLAP
ncbi:MAG: BACON domain-containing carbohydrate-binding protein [Bryobacteraceae bacterium]